MRFAHYLANLLQFDLGYSFSRNLPVSTVLFERLPATLLLMGSAIGLAFLLGSLLGAFAARRANSFADTLISVISVLGYATPLFWLGLMMVLLFTIKLGWLPSSGMRTIGSRATGWAAFVDLIRHAAMPTVTLALFYIAVFTRLMRASILQVSRLDFVTTARAKGASRGAGLSPTHLRKRHSSRGHNARSADRKHARRLRRGGDDLRLARPGAPHLRCDLLTGCEPVAWRAVLCRPCWS